MLTIKKDIIGTINNYKFEMNKTLPLYIMIRNEQGYTLLNHSPRIRSLNLRVLDTVTSGYKDFSVDGRIYKFNGTNYE